ncbi:MAG: PRC-barrel domain-containing protein [Methylobacterium sp.]
MRNPLATVALATALVTAALVPALAQNADTPAAGGPVAAKPATLSDDLRPKFVAQAPSDMVSSKLVGLSVTNSANETIGQIADLVLDEKQQVKAWIVGVGGFLGIGAKYVAIDPTAIKVGRGDNDSLKATIDTTKDQLRAAPEYIYLGKEKPKDAQAAEPARQP